MVTMRRGVLVVIALLLSACERDNPFEQPLSPSFRTSDAPSGLSVSVIAYNRIDLSWQDNSSSPNETGFQVHRANGTGAPFALIASLSASATSYSDAGLTASTSYCYEVRAYRTTGKTTTYSAFSNIACATTAPPPKPAPPSNANAVPSSSSLVTLTWSDNSNDETGFRVEFSLNAGTTWQGIGGDQPANTTTLYDFGRSVEQIVCYRVTAFNSFGSSVPSNVDCTAIPLAPDQLVGVGVSGPAINLSWRDNSSVEDGYEVRRTDPNGQSMTVAPNLPPGTQSYHDAGVQAGTRYTYSVAARKDGGYSYFVSTTAMSALAVPAAPTAADALPQNSSSIALYWTAQPDNVEGFRVERSLDAGASWSTVGTTPWYQTSFGEGGLASEQQACYRVVAFNSAGDSPFSNVDCTTPPAGPTDLAATPIEGLAIDLNWTDNSSVEEGYQVYQLVNNSNCGYYYYYCYPSWQLVAILGPNTTSFRVNGLNDGEFYTFYVIAVKDGGYSDGSGEAGSYPGPAIP